LKCWSGGARPVAHEAPGIARRLLLPVIALALVAALAGTSLGKDDASTPFRLGVYRGSMRADYVQAHEDWLGGRVATVLDFLPYETWADFERPTALLRAWAGGDHDLVLTTPMLPDDGSTLALGAAGAYDAHWRTFGATLVEGGRPDAVIRLGHELNHTAYPWTATGGREVVYAAYFRRIVTVLRTVPNAHLRFTWSVLANATGADAERAYPGDDVVDHIGLDLYDDVHGVPDPEARWQRLREEAYGLDWLEAFAGEHHKPMSFDEWGLVTSTDPAERDPATNSGDDVRFVERMFDLFEHEDVAYACYFDVNTAYGSTDSRLLDGPYPRAAEVYRRRAHRHVTTP
jgi:hypothetical protein